MLYLTAFMVHGITNQMLEGKPPFSTAFRELFDWIKQCVQEASCKKDLYYPGKLIVYTLALVVCGYIYSLVLIAHNGFGFHYLFLMAEIKRHNSELIFSTSEVWFADTLYNARRVSTNFQYFTSSVSGNYSFLKLVALFLPSCPC